MKLNNCNQKVRVTTIEQSEGRSLLWAMGAAIFLSWTRCMILFFPPNKLKFCSFMLIIILFILICWIVNFNQLIAYCNCVNSINVIMLCRLTICSCSKKGGMRVKFIKLNDSLEKGPGKFLSITKLSYTNVNS